MADSSRRIAMDRVEKLFRMAWLQTPSNADLAQRYVDIARRIAMAARVHLPRAYRRSVCRHCKKLILPGVNCRVRIKQKREPHVVMTCLSCDGYMRKPIGEG